MTVHQVPVLSQYEWQKAIKQILSSPPGSPNKGDRYIVGPSPTGVWSDHAGKIATYIDSWDFLSPFKGMIVYNINTDELVVVFLTMVQMLLSVIILETALLFLKLKQLMTVELSMTLNWGHCFLTQPL